MSDRFYKTRGGSPPDGQPKRSDKRAFRGLVGLPQDDATTPTTTTHVRPGPRLAGFPVDDAAAPTPTTPANPVVRPGPRLAGFPIEPEDAPVPNSVEPAPVQAVSPPEYRSAADILEDLQAEKKKKKAAAAKAKRKQQREQIKNIKEILKVPIAEAKAQAAAKLEANKVPSMSSGMFMGWAPGGKGKLVTGGYGSEKIDYMTGTTISDSVWGGRRTARPQGNAPDADLNRDEADFNLRSREGSLGFSTTEPRSFQVRLNTDGQYELQRALDSLVVEYFTDSVCRLCHVSCRDVEDAKNHIVTAHGEEHQPGHDARFGDVVTPRLRKIRIDDRKRQKEGKKILAAAQPEKKIRATPDEAHREGWTQTGNLVQVAGKGWVREWVRKKPVTG